MSCKLQYDVSGAAKSRKTEALPLLYSCKPQSPVAYCTGAQQRRGLGIRKDVRDWKSIVLSYGHVLCVSAIHIPPGRLKFITQIFVIGTARAVNPAYARTIAYLELRNSLPELVDIAYDLVAGYNRKSGWQGPAFNFVQLRMTNATNRNPETYLFRARQWNWNINEF
jgi:hypothetical protein